MYNQIDLENVSDDSPFSILTILLAERGLKALTPLILDGKIHRLHDIGGKPGNTNGWYRFYNASIPYAIIGNWRTRVVFQWCAGDHTKLTSSERQKLSQAIMQADKADKVLQEAKHYYACWRGQKIWDSSPPADPMHPYLVKKGVQQYGLRQKKDSLIIPFYANNKLTTLQFINPDGTKRWLSGGQKKTSCHLIGNVGNIVCIAEGYATGSSVYQATGHSTIIAGDAGNLRWVAEVVRQALLDATIIVCADNDDGTPGNPGVKKAREAAEAIDGLLAIAGEYHA